MHTCYAAAKAANPVICRSDIWLINKEIDGRDFLAASYLVAQGIIKRRNVKSMPCTDTEVCIVSARYAFFKNIFFT